MNFFRIFAYVVIELSFYFVLETELAKIGFVSLKIENYTSKKF
jgi:hypothetical protein